MAQITIYLEELEYAALNRAAAKTSTGDDRAEQLGAAWGFLDCAKETRRQGIRKLP